MYLQGKSLKAQAIYINLANSFNGRVAFPKHFGGLNLFCRGYVFPIQRLERAFLLYIKMKRNKFHQHCHRQFFVTNYVNKLQPY